MERNTHNMGSVWYPTIVAVVCGFSAIPITYFFDSFAVNYNNAMKFVIALIIVMIYFFFIVTTTKNQIKSRMYYGFAFCCMSCVVGILIGLELDGIIAGFMGVYLENCEPYLTSACGAVLSYWDGTGHFICYVLMAYYASNGLSYKATGLYYSGSILNSMIIVLIGACLSKYGLCWSTLLNVPYVLFPLAVAIKCLMEKRKSKSTVLGTSWIDTLLAVLLIEAGVAALIKGLAAVGSNQSIPAWYRDTAEPIINQHDPAPFMYVQGLVTLFYFLPTYIIVAAGLIMNPAQEWLQDLSLLLAGATANSGITTVGMSFHALTEPMHRAPPLINHSAFVAFWISNLLSTVVPHLTALRLLYLVNSKRDSNSKKESINNKKAKVKNNYKKQN